MIFEALQVGPLGTNCYIIGDAESGKALVVDPGDDGELILGRLHRLGLRPVKVLNTHGHFDHVGANARLLSEGEVELCLSRLDLPLLERSVMQAASWGFRQEPSPTPHRFLEEGDVVRLGEMRVEVRATPGHTPGGLSFVTSGMMMVGDTIFAGSVGRTDLEGGDMEQLLASIREKIMVMPDDTLLYPGHGPATTVGRERLHNPFLAP